MKKRATTLALLFMLAAGSMLYSARVEANPNSEPSNPASDNGQSERYEMRINQGPGRRRVRRHRRRHVGNIIIGVGRRRDRRNRRMRIRHRRGRSFRVKYAHVNRVS